MRKLTFSTTLILGLIMAVLLLINWGNSLSNEKEQSYLENQTLVAELTILEEMKMDLQKEVDTLMITYGKVTKENELLEKLLRNAKHKLAKTKYDFQQFRMESTTAIQSLKESIQRLIKAKSTLESTIQVSKENNNQLLEKAGIDRKVFNKIVNESDDIELAFAQLKKEYAIVNEKRIADRRAMKALRIQAKQKPKVVNQKLFRGTAFSTDAEMRNGKVTSKAKRVKKIVVSFDLEDVPEEQLGEKDLYLVIKNSKNKLIKKDGETVKVRIKGLLQEIRIVQTKKVTLEKKQRVRIKYTLKDRLVEGKYEVSVYAKSGLLGKTSFRVE